MKIRLAKDFAISLATCGKGFDDAYASKIVISWPVPQLRRPEYDAWRKIGARELTAL
jgi:hypothetical protein